MEFSNPNLEVWKINELKPEDTFTFECKMCGDCCRKRSEPILLTGADIYRIARAMNTTMLKVVKDNTTGYIGDTSHAPVFVLKERPDGSCRFLRKGRCMVYQDKPTACTLFPLGRIYDGHDQSFHYFLNTGSCQPYHKDGKQWTLQEWLDKFKIGEMEEMTRAWGRLTTGISTVTCKMDKSEIKGRLLDILLIALYYGYDTKFPYIEQVEAYMAALKEVFKREFNKTISFD